VIPIPLALAILTALVGARPTEFTSTLSLSVLDLPIEFASSPRRYRVVLLFALQCGA